MGTHVAAQNTEGGSGRVRRGPTDRHYGGINFCMYNAAGESLLYVCAQERERGNARPLAARWPGSQYCC